MAYPRRRAQPQHLHDGCAWVEPCSASFVYENISDVWRNINNKGDGPPDPDGRGCYKKFCYGTDAIDKVNDTNWDCGKMAAGTGVRRREVVPIRR